jgi:uncharacterized protein (DUF2141 family)
MFVRFLVVSVGVFLVGAASALAGTVTVVPSAALRNSTGMFRCAMFAKSDGYPTEHLKATVRVSAEIRAGEAVCTFKDVPAGDYAFTVLHDENDNMTMDNHQTGMPLEGFGASNDAEPGLMSPPTFEDAVIKVTAEPQRLSLVIRYFEL